MRKKSIFVLLCLILAMNIISADAKPVYVEKEIKRYVYLEEQNDYYAICNMLERMVLKNKFYIAYFHKHKHSGHLYGCDSFGEKKIYLYLSPNDRRLDLYIKLTVEGNYSEREAQDIAYEIMSTFNAQLDRIL